MCVQCAAQGVAYVGVGIVGLRAVGWRARRRTRDLAARPVPVGDPVPATEPHEPHELADAST